MQDRFLFRGKRIDNGEWSQGYLDIETDGWDKSHYYLNFVYQSVPIEINTATIGQCTGIRDRNGKMIFEGDIVIYKTEKSKIRWVDTSFYRQVLDGRLHNLSRHTASKCEIIGNIHDEKE